MVFPAVQGYTLLVTTPGFVGTVTPTSFVYGKTTVSGSPVLINSLGISVSGSLAGCIGTGIGNIIATLHNYTDSGQNVLVQGDSTTVLVSGTSGGGIPCSFNVTVQISSAGQTKFTII